ncbi:OmpA family protein [Rhodocyclaceae bacterium SMB388]
MLTLLLSACSALPGTGSPGSAATPAVPPWIAQRHVLATTLTDQVGLEAQEMDDGSLLVRLPAAEGFAHDSATPKAPLRDMLDTITPLLMAFPDTELQIFGHTDSIGSELHNLRLSISRAEAVMDYLRAKGIALARLSADGRGEAEPIADNATDIGRATNRRVELVLRPIQ